MKKLLKTGAILLPFLLSFLFMGVVINYKLQSQVISREVSSTTTLSIEQLKEKGYSIRPNSTAIREVKEQVLYTPGTVWYKANTLSTDTVVYWK